MVWRLTRRPFPVGGQASRPHRRLAYRPLSPLYAALMRGVGWRCDTWDGWDHVYIHPLDDTMGHDVRSDDCWCGPRNDPVKRDDGSVAWLIVHHSLDGREAREGSSA